MPRRRAIVLITEGAAPELIDRFGPGRLPAFHRLLSEGTRGTLRNEPVPYEPPGLISAFSGHPPPVHGVFSYWKVHDPDYRPVVLDSSSPRRPLLWHRPELSGRRVAVVNVFGTHPVRPVDGHVISYPMRATTHACHPRGLPVELAGAGIRPVHDVAVWFSGQAREDFVSPVLRADRERSAAALRLADGADLTVLNLTAIDRLSHVYWQELEPGSPVPEDDLAVLRAYQVADETLGRLLDRADAHTSVLAFSEIGFGPLRSYCSVNDVLAEAGLLEPGPDGRPDWSRTTAFESVQGSQGVNINLAGRYREGSVPPGDLPAVLDKVRGVLLDHVNPLTGRPLLADALPREEVYPGPEVAEAPDLVLFPADERYLPLGDPFWSGRTHRRLQSGWHRRESYWAGLGPAFAGAADGGTDGGTAVPHDIAPTIMTMLGLPVPPDLPGRTLDGGAPP
ncbi:alkaline phosphatase family protein [Actinomadura viridis]|uniref:alkaline phosphatase family protein n=1 Tax=Actinomadura viridis TaxID=58110 RepID=UPI003688AF8A